MSPMAALDIPGWYVGVSLLPALHGAFWRRAGAQVVFGDTSTRPLDGFRRSLHSVSYPVLLLWRWLEEMSHMPCDVCHLR